MKWLFLPDLALEADSYLFTKNHFVALYLE